MDAVEELKIYRAVKKTEINKQPLKSAINFESAIKILL